MKKLYTFLPLLFLAVFLVSCINDQVDVDREFYYPDELTVLHKSLNLPDEPLDYNVNLPAHIINGGLFARSINKDIATLGRVLFYDEALSSTGDISCSSCHHQENAFADSKALSDGVNNNQTVRNSLALGSVVSFSAYYGNSSFGSSFGVPFMWDNRFASATEQAKAAITSTEEMGLTIDELVNIVENKDYYAPLFRRAFGNQDVSEDRILNAIAEFIDGLGTFESTFDKAAIAENNGSNLDADFGMFSASENMGKQIYMENCASCHSASFGRPILNAANNGLDMQYTDEGVGGATGLNFEKNLFKVPTLRNIAVSAPYMHDGRFNTLEEVVDFYSDNIADHPKLSSELRDGNGWPKRLHLSENEKIALVDFLTTLTDDTYLQSERYSNPFK